MSEKLEALVKVVAFGIPALLIILGFFSYIGGSTVEAIGTLVEAMGAEGAGDLGMKSFGTGMVVVGITIYLIEFFTYVYLDSY